MAASLPKAVKSGEPITAALFNQLLAYVRARANIQPGPGIDINRSNDRTLISLARPGKLELYEGIITDAPVPAGGDDVPENVTYSFKILGFEGSQVFGRLPDWGRDVDAARVIPAAVDDPCMVAVRVDATGERYSLLWIMTEKVSTYDCAAAAERTSGDRAEVEFRRLVEAVVVELGERGLVVGVRQ